MNMYIDNDTKWVNKLFDPNNFMVSVSKSNLQLQLERNGCIFHGQQRLLSDHEKDIYKPCFCGRKVYK